MSAAGWTVISSGRRPVTACAAAVLSLLLSPLYGQEPQTVLTTFFHDYLEADLRAHPLRATQLGDHRFDAELDDVSAEARQAWNRRVKETLDELPRRVNYAGLPRAAQIDYEVFRDALQQELWIDEQLRPWETDPRIYTSMATDCVYALFTQSSLPRETNLRNAVARMQQIPFLLAAARRNLNNPPRVVTETAIKQNQGAIGFYERELFQLAGETPPAEPLQIAAQQAVEALREHHQYLEQQLLPAAQGEWRLGKELYAQKFRLELGTDAPADEVFAAAEAEFQRAGHELYVLSRQVWSRYYPEQPIPPDDAAGRRETIRAVLDAISQDHATPEELTAEARATVADLKTFIARRNILTLPDPDRCEIVEMPEFQRGNSVAHLRPSPPLDADTPSYYAISPPPADWSPARVETFVREYNRRMLQILTIHEAYPGHYVQLDYANRQPSLIRKVYGSGVYCEGWAVYCERMLLDEGFSQGDVALRLQGLKFWLRTVANAILDHRMHCTEFRDEEALRFLTVEAFQSEGEALLKIIRAKQSSVQLSSYFVGRLAFDHVRRSVQRQQGAEFDLPAFHAALLHEGSLPVKYLLETTRTARQLPPEPAQP